MGGRGREGKGQKRDVAFCSSDDALNPRTGGGGLSTRACVIRGEEEGRLELSCVRGNKEERFFSGARFEKFLEFD